MSADINWAKAIKPLIKKYKGLKHPLEYKNIYQLLVMVILAARDSDKNINAIAPALFKAFPDIESLAKAMPEDLHPYVHKIRSFAKKSDWIISIAKEIKKNKNIPLKMDALVALPGIGRKSANVIMREAGAKAEGVMVDLHVVRVAQRLGIATSADPKKIEEQIMEAIPQKDWGEAGMAMSFLGREVCRPTHPEHDDCVMKKVCAYYKEQHTDKKARKAISEPPRHRSPKL
jgi:endonuclease-3